MLRVLALTGLMLALLVACSDDSRPSVAEWEPVWASVVDAFPSAAELGQPPDHKVCSQSLGVLRSTSGDLFPTPDLAIDDVVTDWVRIAENMLFECPPANQEVPSLEYAYGELSRLQAEVAVVLDMDSATD